MTTKYHAMEYLNKIEKVEIEKETDKFVIIKGRRSQKISENEGYFNSFEEARMFLFNYAKIKIDVYNAQVEYYRKRLHEVFVLEE